MSELCHFSSLVISDFILYLSYFLFFSPYLLKLFSFLSPLFITTSLLFLAFLLHTQSSQINFTSILQRLQLNRDSPNEEEEDNPDLGIYEIVFGPPSMAAVTQNQNENLSQILEQTPQKDHILEPNPLLGSDNEAPIIGKIDENKVSESEILYQTHQKDHILELNPLLGSDNEAPIIGKIDESKVSESENLDQTHQKDHILEPNPFLGSDNDAPIIGKIENFKVSESEAPALMEEKRLENFLKILDEFERLASNVNEKKKKKQEPSIGAKSDKVIEKKQKSLFINGSEAAACNYNNRESSTVAKSHSQRINDQDSLSTYGSMRREREWKRTLAGKLFEERHNAAAAGGSGGGGEAMDSLWEAYEVDSNKSIKKVGRREKILEEDDVIGGQLCCLQALKMSAGKMNLGVGKPNLVKISKAIKGIGWLHNLTKNSKKVHNNGDHRF